MPLEKIIKVRTFITPQKYEDEVSFKGFNKDDNLKTSYIKLLGDFNRAVLKISESQEVTTIMSYHKEEYNNNSQPITQNSV